MPLLLPYCSGKQSYGNFERHPSITADSALRLAKYFGTTPEFWLNLQSAYDLKIAKLSAEKKIEKEVHAYHPGTTNTAHT